jgi:predicted DNA-binding transcriptional regulator AlpA
MDKVIQPPGSSGEPPLSKAAPSKNQHKTKDEYLPDDPLLNAKKSAAETGRGVSTFWRDVRNGILPAPYYLTDKMPRWRRSELRASVASCPRTVRKIGKRTLISATHLHRLISGEDAQ